MKIGTKQIFSFTAAFAAILLFFIPEKLAEHEFPEYRVVLDPGHGGVLKLPVGMHGDRYDSITCSYLDFYRPGAETHGMRESVIAYDIARRAVEILKDCGNHGDFGKFQKVLSRYGVSDGRRVTLNTSISRGPCIPKDEAEGMADPNAEFRFFDYPDRKTGEMKHGRLSRINRQRPHLVVSIHMASAAPADYPGMSPVLAAPYRLLEKGFRYLRGEISSTGFSNEKGLKHWFVEKMTRSPYRWFLNDSSAYFTGYPLKKSGQADLNDFQGYRYNMVDWAYRDSVGWEAAAKNHPSGTAYSSNIKSFKPQNRFWERERSVYESYRRDGGQEGFGGDNAYSSYEIIRFIQYSLRMKGVDNKKMIPGKPYVSTWIMPIHVNAVNPFIELGYFSRRFDRMILQKHRQEIAEGIAVGIYSLFAGLKVRDRGFPAQPRGSRIDLEKYRITSKEYYFDQVTE